MVSVFWRWSAGMPVTVEGRQAHHGAKDQVVVDAGIADEEEARDGPHADEDHFEML
jgi:hypothetical protein